MFLVNDDFCSVGLQGCNRIKNLAGQGEAAAGTGVGLPQNERGRVSFAGLTAVKSGKNWTLKYANICLNAPQKQGGAVRRWYFSSYFWEWNCCLRVGICSGGALFRCCVRCEGTLWISVLQKIQGPVTWITVRMALLMKIYFKRILSSSCFQTQKGSDWR